MIDPFETYATGLDDPPANAFNITPDDGADLAVATRGFSVAVAGFIAYDSVESGVNIVEYVLAGFTHPGRLKKVWATGTTATGIVGKY